MGRDNSEDDKTAARDAFAPFGGVRSQGALVNEKGRLALAGARKAHTAPEARGGARGQRDVAGPESRAACAPRRKTGPRLRHFDISASTRRHASGAVGLDVCMDVCDQKRPETRYSRRKTFRFALKRSISFRFAAFRAGFAPIFDPISPWRPARGDFVRQKWANRVPARALYFGVSK